MTGRGRALNRCVVDTNIVSATMQGTPEAVAFMEAAESTKSEVLYSVIVEAVAETVRSNERVRSDNVNPGLQTFC